MSFTIYEVISHIVPGYIVVFFLRNQLGIDITDMGGLEIVALAYAIGFVIQTLASWAENIMYITWGGKPSIQLLKGKQIWKVKFPSWKEARELLLKEAKQNRSDISEDTLFEIAKRKVDSLKYERVISFNAVYALSRAMTMSFLVSFLGSIFFKQATLQLTLILGFLTVISWLRAKQRGFYYCKEVLSMYLVNSEKKEEF